MQDQHIRFRHNLILPDKRNKRYTKYTMINHPKPLTVYKASAGSGKTFTLTKEYIKLVIKDPTCYRNILAVTFTNKATEEMKMRILSTLYGIWKQLPDSVDYLKQITKEIDVSPELASAQAGKALSLLVHNYNYFRVETIDTFFQSVLRNLARELDLTANLRIELNDYQVEDMAVDELIENLNTTSRLLLWIMEYIRENINDDKSWNVIGKIKSFGIQIFKEYYKQHSKQLNATLSEPNFFKTFTDSMKDVINNADDKVKMIVSTFEDILQAYHLDITDFSYGASGVCSYFVKLKKGIYDESLLTSRVLKGMEDPKAWVKKSGQNRDLAQTAVNEELFQLLKFAEEKRPTIWRMAQSAKLTMRHINQLRLLNSIEDKVREMNQEANRFLLSDTQTLLHSLIQNSDSPFIFEKIGTQLEHIMIDEFQDTSTIQWQNFKVLLEETMSHGKENLIVGDVKQSIYRWRDGDWRLLNEIQNQFDNNEQQLQIQPLMYNYRSNRNIVEFNNLFFRVAADYEYNQLKNENPLEAEQMKLAYADVEQRVPEGKPAAGKVEIHLLADEDWSVRTLELTAQTINNLHDQGVPYNKIAILTRTNGNIQSIADEFMKNYPSIPLVSDEAFRLDASMAVNVIMDALHLLTHPNDILTRANLVKSYRKIVDAEGVTDTQLFVIPSIDDRQERENALIAHMNQFLPSEFVETSDELVRMPLFDLVERLFALFALHKLSDQSAYICAFYDTLNHFITDYTTDIDAFVTEWDNRLHLKTIQSDEINGVRILSIHKSKGLEFDHVIIPYCDWRLEKVGTNIWCEPQEEPFNRLPLVPVDFSKKEMMGTIYEHDYLHEHLQNVVDNMNLLYVAFTRASRNLFIIARQGNESMRSAVIQEAMYDDCWTHAKVPVFIEGLPDKSIDKKKAKKTDSAEEPIDILFEYGELDIASEEKQEKQSDNVFKQHIEPESLQITNYVNKVEFKQSNKSRDFIGGEDDDEFIRQRNYIQMGNVLHNLFSTIHTADDIESALQQLELDGVIYDKNITKEKIEKMLRKRLETKEVSDWFSPRWTLFNECSILYVEDEKDEEGNITSKVQERRPDRVMTDGNEMIVVDFKFGRYKEEYDKQVREYMSLLQSMGYPQVKGYLWFVYKNEIKEVTL